jgi:hypothetical protein
MLIKSAIHSLIRRRKPVIFPDLSRTEPVSASFGLDRGKPIDRHYIEAFLDANRDRIRGTALEIADDTYSRRFGAGQVDRFEVLSVSPDHRAASVYGDLSRPEALPVDLADCFICTQTLNFIFDVQRAVAGIRRLLKPGGAALVTVAGISQISRYDHERWGDYWRFTPLSIQRLFEAEFGPGIAVRSHGNVLAATALLHGLAMEDLPDPSLLDDMDPDYPVVITVIARKPR